MKEFKRTYISDSVVGVKKNQNQDNTLVINDPNFSLYVVFDGVSSAKNGYLGTILAKEFIIQNYSTYLNVKYSKLDELMYYCNEYITSKNVAEVFTTYSATLIFNEKKDIAIISSLGDTRIYLVSNQFIEQVSIDDTFSFSSNIVTKCLGMDYLILEDFTTKTIYKNDMGVLICTDGFYSILEKEKMSFFMTFNKKNLNNTKSGLKSLISGRNIDDSTFIFIK